MTYAETRYQEGRRSAEFWIKRNGNLWATSSSDEAYDNGFCDRLREERMKLDNKEMA